MLTAAFVPSSALPLPSLSLSSVAAAAVAVASRPIAMRQLQHMRLRRSSYTSSFLSTSTLTPCSPPAVPTGTSTWPHHPGDATHHHRAVTRCSSSTTSSSSSPLPSPSSSPSSSARFTAVRLVVFCGMSVTYALYVFLRSTFTYVAPAMVSGLGLTLPQIGQISSAFPLAYGMSRLFTGVLVDRMPAHHALCVGLALAGAVNLSMGGLSAAATSVPALALLWAANGLVQGVGAGASAKMLTAWFPKRSRGRYWALWSTSANVGAFLAPIVVARLVAVAAKRGAAAQAFSAGLVVPGVAAVAWAAVMSLVLRSSPVDAGFNIPTWDDDDQQKQTSKQKQKQLGKQGWRQTLVDGVLRNRAIWALAAAYFFVYLIRSGTKSWLHFWLAAPPRSCTPSDAAYRASGMEVGGIVGTFSAGLLSDLTGGRRVQVTIAFMCLLMGAIIVTATLPPLTAPPAAYFAAFAAVGFAINGPQMLIGLIGAELCDRRVVATATGVLGCISYLGAAASGFPLSVVTRNAGWPAYFAVLVAAAVLAVACLAPLWRTGRGKLAQASATTSANRTEQDDATKKDQ